MTTPEPAPYEVLQGRCTTLTQQTLQIRAEVTRLVPGSGADPHIVHAALVNCASYLATVEGLMTQALALRGAARRRAKVLSDAASDAWDTASSRLRRTAVGDRYQSARQHEADCNLEILHQLRASREAATFADLADETFRIIEIIYRGMLTDHRTLDSRVQFARWLATLERLCATRIRSPLGPRPGCSPTLLRSLTGGASSGSTARRPTPGPSSPTSWGQVPSECTAPGPGSGSTTSSGR